jgi:hypothetical protein
MNGKHAIVGIGRHRRNQYISAVKLELKFKQLKSKISSVVNYLWSK